MAEILIFMHLGKTAGGTFNRAFSGPFAQQEAFHASGKRSSALGLAFLEDIQASFHQEFQGSDAKLKLVFGHVPFGTHQLFQRKAKYFSFVRDPVDRIISQYYYLRRIDLSAWPPAQKFLQMSLLDFVQSRMSPDTYNGQVRAISGMACPEAVDGRDIAFSAVTESHWEQAVSNIKEHFLFLAPHSEVDSAICVIARMYGFSIEQVCAPLNNVTVDRPAMPAVSPEVRRLAAEHNMFDVRLINYARATFDEFKNALPYDLASDVVKLRTLRAANTING